MMDKDFIKFVYKHILPMTPEIAMGFAKEQVRLQYLRFWGEHNND